MPAAPRHRRCLAVVAAAGVLFAACSAEPEEPRDTPEPTTPAEPTESPTPEPSPEPTEDEPVLDAHGVSAAHPLAAEAGGRILEAGGSAVDAAIATAFTVAVVEPFASGIGGGGATIVAPTGAEPEAYDYREVVADDGRIPASGTGVPGFVAGMAALHEDHGELPWEDLLQPAIELAEEGFPVSDFLALRMRSDFGPAAVSGLEHFAPGGAPLAEGETLVQQELAGTMRTIADGGAEAFYTGAFADRLTAVDGLDEASLSAYQEDGVVRSEPVSGRVGDHEVLSAAPALPGAAVIQLLQVAEAAGAGEATPGSAEYIETVSRAWQVADESTHAVFGDPAFVDVPVEELTDPAANQDVAADVMAFGGADAGPPGIVTASGEESSPNTTHLTVVDSDGLMVSMTNTITSFWGAQETVGGFFLNDQLTRFEAIAGPANEPAPGRRSVSWSAPAVVLDDDGRPVLGIGTPGGRQIPNVLANVLLRWGLHGQSLEEAVASPRFILDGGTLRIEEQPRGDAAAALAGLGWTVEVPPAEQAVFGSVQALEVDHETGEVTSVADGRREADYLIQEP